VERAFNSPVYRDDRAFRSPANVLRDHASSRGTVRPLERSRLRNTASGGAQTGASAPKGAGTMSLGTILIIILVIALLGGFSGLGGGPFYGTGYYGGGGLGLVLLIIVILVVLGRI
jgi:hypothetical protein